MRLDQLSEGEYFISDVYLPRVFKVQHKLVRQTGGIGVLDQVQPYGNDMSGVYHPSMEVEKIDAAEAKKRIKGFTATT